MEVVRQIYAAWARNESAGRWMHEDIEYVNPDDAVEQGTLQGRKSFALTSEVFDEIRFAPERYVAAGDDVVVIATMHTRGKASGAATEMTQI